MVNTPQRIGIVTAHPRFDLLDVMEINYTPDQKALSAELRAYYDKLLDADTVEELSHGHGIGEATKRVWKQMCSDGWAGMGWPKQYGGQERGPIDQFIFFDESMRAGAPVPMLTLNTVGPDRKSVV